MSKTKSMSFLSAQARRRYGHRILMTLNTAFSMLLFMKEGGEGFPLYCFGKGVNYRRRSKAQSGKEPIGVVTAGRWSRVGDQ